MIAYQRERACTERLSGAYTVEPMVGRGSRRFKSPPRDEERCCEARSPASHVTLNTVGNVRSPANRAFARHAPPCAKVLVVTQASYVDRARVFGKATISVGVGSVLLSLFLPNVGCIGPALSFLGFAAGLCIVLVGAILSLLAWRAERHPAIRDRELDEPWARRDSRLLGGP